MEYILPYLIILFLLMVNALFVAGEFAVLAAPRPRIERLAATGNYLARLVHKVQGDQRKLDYYIATAQVGISAAGVGLGMYGEHFLAEQISPILEAYHVASPVAVHGIAIAIAVAILTFLHVVLGEMIPKSLALFHAEKAAMGVAWPMEAAGRILSPLVVMLNGIGNKLLEMLRVPTASHTQTHTTEELEMIIEDSQSQGALNEQQGEMLVNLLRFDDLSVKKIMVPRTSVIGLPVDAKPESVLDAVRNHRHTRYPVYDETLDSIIGTAHVKEIFRELRTHPEEPLLIRTIKPPVFVTEQMPVEALLSEYKQQGSQIAIVVDEYGGMSGIVTLEDVLEEIFGEVQDEFDDEEDPVERIGETTSEISGLLRIDEFEEEFDANLGDPEVDTVGGLVQMLLQGPGQVGDIVEYSGFRFTVVEVDGLSVTRLMVEAINQE